jgi:Zn-dependent membrane protease YugP
MVFDPLYFLFLIPPMLLGMWAQYRVKSTYAEASQVPAGMTGAAAARRILDSYGLHQVGIEMVPGTLSDHYDPREKVLRLSQDVYHGRSAAAVGIAAHEAGHALQDAEHYAPLVIRNAAVPIAGFGSNLGIYLAIFGLLFATSYVGMVMVLGGIALYSAFVFFQLVNLPVEYNASARAKLQLAELGITSTQQGPYIEKMLSAAALTYVAATLSAVMTLAYLLFRLMGQRSE